MGCAIFDFRRFAQTNSKLEKLALLFLNWTYEVSKKKRADLK